MKSKIIVTVGRHNKLFQGRMNQRLRCVGEVGQWIREQVKGGFSEVMASILEEMLMEKSLDDIGFELPASRDTRQRDAPTVIVQDSLADLMTTYSFKLVGNRISRELFMLIGWPAISALWNHEDPQVQAMMLDSLRVDADNDKRFKEAEDRGVVGVREINKRSIFQQAAVQQLVAIAEHESWEKTDRMSSFIDNKFRKVIQTQINEDGIRVMKEDAKKQRTHNGREVRAFHSLLKSDLVNGVHDYDIVQPQTEKVDTVQLTPLTKQNFSVVEKDVKLELPHLVSFRQEAPWFSTTPIRHCVQYADLVLRSHVVNEDAFDDVVNLWQNSFMCIDHHVVVNKKGNADTFFFPIRDIAGGLVFVRDFCCER